jgi:hypothetical protein
MQPIKPTPQRSYQESTTAWTIIICIVLSLFFIFGVLALNKQHRMQKESDCTQIATLLEQIPIEYEEQKLQLTNEYAEKCFISWTNQNE